MSISSASLERPCGAYLTPKSFLMSGVDIILLSTLHQDLLTVDCKISKPRNSLAWGEVLARSMNTLRLIIIQCYTRSFSCHTPKHMDQPSQPLSSCFGGDTRLSERSDVNICTSACTLALLLRSVSTTCPSSLSTSSKRPLLLV